MKGTLFGKAPFDLTPVGWCIDKYRYDDIFTGIIYYKPIEKHILKTGWKDTFTEDFHPELHCRFRIAEEEIELTQEDINFMNIEEVSIYLDLERVRKEIDKWK